MKLESLCKADLMLKNEIPTSIFSVQNISRGTRTVHCSQFVPITVENLNKLRLLSIRDFVEIKNEEYRHL